MLTISVPFVSISFRFRSHPRTSFLFGSFHFIPIAHTPRLRVFQLSYALRGYDWEPSPPPRPSARIVSALCSSLLRPSLRFASSSVGSALSLANSTIKNWFHVHQPFVVKMGNSAFLRNSIPITSAQTRLVLFWTSHFDSAPCHSFQSLTLHD